MEILKNRYVWFYKTKGEIEIRSVWQKVQYPDKHLDKMKSDGPRDNTYHYHNKYASIVAELRQKKAMRRS